MASDFFQSLFYPWNAYFGLFANIFLALVQGWGNFVPFDAAGFVDAYILIPLFPIILVVYKLWNKTRWHRLEEIDLDVGRRGDVDAAKQATRLVPDEALTPKVEGGRLRSIWKSI